MLTVLNEDVLKLISTNTNQTWLVFAQTCTYFQRFNDQLGCNENFYANGRTLANGK